MWVFTVWSVMVSRSAMSALDSPGRSGREHFRFARGQPLDRALRRSADPLPGELGDEPPRDLGGQQGVAARATTRTACSSSGKVASFSRKPLAPAVRASYTYSSRPNVVSISALVAPRSTPRRSRAPRRCQPSRIRMSSSATSGRSSAAHGHGGSPSPPPDHLRLSSQCVFSRPENAVGRRPGRRPPAPGSPRQLRLHEQSRRPAPAGGERPPSREARSAMPTSPCPARPVERRTDRGPAAVAHAHRQQARP